MDDTTIASDAGRAPSDYDADAPSTILVADQRPDALRTLAGGLSGDGHRVLIGGDEGAALDALARERPEMALLHEGLLGADGDIIRHLRSLAPGLPIVVYGHDAGAERWRRRLAAQAVGTAAVDGDDPARLRELVTSTLLATRCVGRLRDEYELRTLLLAQLCHTLRAPLHVIQGYAELLRAAPASPATHAALAGLSGAVASALQITAEHVTVASPDAPGLDVRCEPIELDGLLGELRHGAARPSSGLPVRLLASAPFPGAVLYGDGGRLRVLLAHLVACTAQASSRPTIRLRVRCTAGGTRFELPAGSGPAGGRAAPADEAGAAAADDAGWAIAERLCAMLGGSIATRRQRSGGSLVVLDLPTHLIASPAASGQALVH